MLPHLLLLLLPFGTAWAPSSRPSAFFGDKTRSCRLRQQQFPNVEPDSLSSSSRRAWLKSLSQATGLTLLPDLSSAKPVLSSPSVCDATVTVWERGNRSVYLLGTAHISEVSAALAGALVRDVHPNAVFVELDVKRVGGVISSSSKKEAIASAPDGIDTTAGALPATDSNDPTTSSLTQVVVPAPLASSTRDALVETSAPPPQQGNWLQRKALNFAASALGNSLKSMYQNLESSGFTPGEEFATAIREGQKVGASIVLGDQDVEVTLRRLTQALAITDLNKLLDPDAELEKTLNELVPGGGGGGRPGLLPPERGQYDDPAQFKQELGSYVEVLKSRDTVRKLMGQLRQVAPALVQVMLEERDVYMARGLDTLNQFEVIVAVMGIAHQDGVEANLQAFGWKRVALKC